MSYNFLTLLIWRKVVMAAFSLMKILTSYECNLSPVILKGDQIKGVKLLHFVHFHINFPRLKTREIMRIDTKRS